MALPVKMASAFGVLESSILQHEGNAVEPP
jgi:hypothetical protein